MAYAPRKKKSLWDNIVDTVGGAVDRVVPGDQSNLRSATTRANNAQVSPVSRPQAQQQPIIQPKPQESIFDKGKSMFEQAGKTTGAINDATYGTGVNIVKGIGGITQRAVGTATQAGTGIYGLGDALSSQIQGKTDEANEKSREYTQLIKEMGNGQAIDGGRTSFMSTNTLEGKSKPTDFAKEYIAAGVDTSSLLPIGNVAKGVKAGTGLTVNAAKKIFVSNAKQAPIYGTSELVNDKVQGREITPTSVAMNYGGPLLLGSAAEGTGVMLGSAGRQAGKTAKVVNTKIEQANPRVKELDRARVTMQKAFDVETDPKRRAQINQGLTKLNKERESLTQGGYINGDKPRNQVDDMLDDAITPKPKTVKVNSDLERLQQRRAEFQKNPAEVEARVQAEVPEVPQRLTREDIQARLTEMQVDPRNFNNVSMSSLQNIFENTDFSKIKNPGGFIRSELDRLAQSNADNTSNAALRNNVTQQRIQPETVNPQDEISSIYRRANNSRGGKLTISEENRIAELQGNSATIPIQKNNSVGSSQPKPTIEDSQFSTYERYELNDPTGNEYPQRVSIRTHKETGKKQIEREMLDANGEWQFLDRTDYDKYKKSLADDGIVESDTAMLRRKANYGEVDGALDYTRTSETPVTAPKGDYDTVQNGVEGRVIDGQFVAKPTQLNPADSYNYPTYDDFIDNTLKGERPVNVDPNTGEVLDEFTMALNDAIAKAGKEIDNINTEVRNLGFEPEDIRRKMTAANRKEYQMTPDEVNAANLYTNRLDQARGSLEKSGTTIEGQQDFYTPQVKGDPGLPSSREDLADFGYKEKRTNAYELDEINYGDNPQIDYIVKAENRDILVQKATNDAAVVDKRPMTPDDVREAAKETIELQKKIKDKSNSEGVLTNDTLADLYSIGKKEGYVQADNNYSPGVIVQEPKAMLERAGIYKNGFEQFDNSVGYANEFVDVLTTNNVPENQVGAALEQSIRSRMPDADQSSVNSAVEYALKSMARNGVEAKNAASIFERAFKNVAKSELFRVGKTTRFTSTKMNKVVNEQINGRILTDSYKKNAAQEFDRFLSERINASLRGLNIVSALFEAGDVANIFAKFGIKDMKNGKFGFGKVDGERFALTKKYGQTNSHFATNDIPDVSKLDKIWADNTTNLARKVYDSYRAVENKLLFFRYVEEIKTEMYFRAAENYYKSPQGGSLQGGALVDKVMEDFLTTMLPHKLATANRIVGKAPSTITQYLNWSLQATKRLGRTLAGADTGGKFANKTRVERVARGISAELVPKIGVAVLAGVPIMQVLGMRDFTNATSGDFTGIDEEDKNAMDTVVQTLSISPAVGVAGNFYFANRRNQIADERKAAGETYGAERRVEDQPLNVAKESAKMLIPFRTQAKKTADVLKAHNQGYYENRDGRIQAEGPNGLELAMGLVTGKGYTPTMRDYQDAPNVVSVIQGKASPLDLLTKNQSVSNLVQAVTGEGTRQYKRPLTDDYSKKFKEVDAGARTAMLQGGRQYNQYLDDLKRNQPDQYNNYVSSMDGNHVNPEYWNTNTKGGQDLTNFHMMRDRKKQLKNDLGTPYDPLYDLPDDQARSVLQYQSSPTGTDLALRNALNKEQWYKDYKATRSAYYDSLPPAEPGKYNPTERVKQWDALDDQLSSFYFDKDSTEVPAWAEKYPLVYERKKLEYGSPEWKSFNKAYYDEHEAQKKAYEETQLNIINEMRKIEGVSPMSWEQYQQVTEVADTEDANKNGILDSKEKDGYSKSGGSGKGSGISPDAGGSYSHTGASKAAAVNKVKAKVVKIKPRTELKKITVKRSKSV